MDWKEEVAGKAEAIVNALKRGKDVEIRRSKDGLAVLEVDRRAIKEPEDGWEQVSK